MQSSGIARGRSSRRYGDCNEGEADGGQQVGAGAALLSQVMEDNRMGVRDVIVVVQKGDHSLGYYDFATGAEIDRVPVDPFPHEFSLSPDGRFAYLAHFGVALAEHAGPGGNTVSVVDIQARRRIGTIDCKSYRRPHDVVFDGNGWLYILSEGTSTLLVVKGLASGRIDQMIPTRGRGSHMVSVSRDGSLAFCSGAGKRRGPQCACFFPGVIRKIAGVNATGGTNPG